MVAELRERVVASLIRWAPKGTFSHVAGACARQVVPRPLRRPLYTAFARRVGARLDEADRPLEAYPTFDAFFTRGLRPDARPVATDPGLLVSPCDGVVSDCGIAAAGRLIQAKRHDYKLGSLLCDPQATERFDGGTYVTIYLAPSDYHRVHSPEAGAVNGYQHLPGAFYPVNAVATRHIGGIFAHNERLITYLDTPLGEIALVMVAAAGVGHMTVCYDAVATHDRKHGRPGPRVRLAAPRPVRRGEHLGTFHLGSTVILLFEPGRMELLPEVVGQHVRMGAAIARRLPAGALGGTAT